MKKLNNYILSFITLILVIGCSVSKPTSNQIAKKDNPNKNLFIEDSSNTQAISASDLWRKLANKDFQVRESGDSVIYIIGGYVENEVTEKIELEDNCIKRLFIDTNYNHTNLNLSNSDTIKSIQTGSTSANKTGIKGLTHGSVKGKVLDESNEGFPFVNVTLYQNGNIRGGVTTDFDGVFKISNIHAGEYDLEIKFVGYSIYRLNGVVVKGGKLLPLSPIKLRESDQLMEKPIIYLYPEKTQEIEVQLDYDGELTHTYPKYTGGWKVTAKSDGTLFDAKNQEYYALYWEGKPNKDYTINEGFVVPGEQTIDFLENTLSKLGLNRKEANEFIIYWLPKMENNPYNLIHFSTTQYEEMAKLNITPTPETLIRVMMVFKPSDNPIKIKKQNLNSMSKKRKGFTVVEWGGHPLPKSYSLDL
jgi:hypothetical protein